MKRLILFAGILALFVSPRPVSAAPIVGQQLFASGGDVIAHFMGHTAGFTNELYLFSASDLTTPLAVTATVGSLGAGQIFVKQTSPVGSQVNLGSFAAGTELVFAIYVQDSDDLFFMGLFETDGAAYGLFGQQADLVALDENGNVTEETETHKRLHGYQFIGGWRRRRYFSFRCFSNAPERN